MTTTVAAAPAAVPLLHTSAVAFFRNSEGVEKIKDRSGNLSMFSPVIIPKNGRSIKNNGAHVRNKTKVKG